MTVFVCLVIFCVAAFAVMNRAGLAGGPNVQLAWSHNWQHEGHAVSRVPSPGSADAAEARTEASLGQGQSGIDRRKERLLGAFAA